MNRAEQKVLSIISNPALPATLVNDHTADDALTPFAADAVTAGRALALQTRRGEAPRTPPKGPAAPAPQFN